jgi:RNase P/RNase MRP subunit POP5
VVKVFRRRYVAFRLASPEAPARRELSAMLASALLSSPSPGQVPRVRLLFYDQYRRVGVLSCDHRSLPEVRVLLSSLCGAGLKIQTIRASGTIMSLLRKSRLNALRRFTGRLRLGKKF